MNTCDCNAGLSNTGRPSCVPIQAVTSSLILVPLKDSEGNENCIDLTQPIPDWNALINEPDASKRWFPLPAFEDVTKPKADSQFAEAASGRKARLRQGKRSFQGSLWEQDSSPVFLGKLEKAGCVDFGFYDVDVEGNLIGSQSGDKLCPIPVDKASWDPKLMFAEDDQVSHIMLDFDWNRLFDESTLRMLTTSEAGINFTELEGLIDVEFENTASTTASTTFDAVTCYGTALNRLKYMGATSPSDWTIDNETTLLPVVIDLVTENPDGTYQLDHAVGVNSNDVLKVSVSKDGFIGEFTVTVA